jgi:very-short-patch-repair endonuclease
MMAQEMHKGAPPKHFYYSGENRKLSTKAEQVLWTHLRNRKLHGYKFRRQHPILDFIADFYCHGCKLIIELDGEYHNAIEQRQYDEGRT